MAIHEFNIPGVGLAHAGFDWILLADADSEFNRLAARYEAKWYSTITGNDGEDEKYVAFVNKSDSKKAPYSGAGILKRILKDDQTFISILKVEENRYWILVMEDGLPTCNTMRQSVDFVGDFDDTLRNLRNIFASIKDPTTIPVYTDCEELVEQISYPLTTRLFSIEFIAESLKKKDLGKFKFKHYTSVPVLKIAIILAIVLIASGGGYYWHETSQNDMRAAAEAQRKIIEQRKIELANAVSESINMLPPVKQSANAYYSAVAKAPIDIAGWSIVGATCTSGQCVITYKGQSFATWSGYLSEKPIEWSSPIFGSDFEVVHQPVNVDIGDYERRTPDMLPAKSKLILEFGNLAQVAKEIGIPMRIEGEPYRVVGNAEDTWVPVQVKFAISGSIEVLSGLVERLPVSAGLSNIDFSIGDNLTFELNGDLYANP